MSDWIIGPDVLAHARLEISHLAVAVASLRSAVATEAAELAEITAGDPLAAALVREGIRPRWTADCFALAVPAGASLAAELDDIRAQADAKVRHDIVIAGQATRPGATSLASWLTAEGEALSSSLADGEGLGRVIAAVLSRTWRTRVQPDWGATRWVLEADIISRTTALRRGGWAAALEGMRPGTTYRSGGALTISALGLPAQNLTDAHLSLHPVPGTRGFAMCNPAENRFALTYPATGSGLTVKTPADAGLDRLVGRNRATILRLLDQPMSPSQLAAHTQLPLGSVGRHLAVLLDAGIVTRRRAGREVLYWQTPRGNDLAAR